MASSADPPPLTPPTGRRTSSSFARGNDEAVDTCRICRGEATSDQPLFYPCKCSGSIKYVHQDCLMEWLAHSQKKYCELCKTPFRFTKLYDQSMPDTVPWPLFLRQVAIHSVKAATRWARYAIVLFIWLCWLPWTIRQIWRALFWLADGSWLTTQEMQAAVEAYTSRLTNTSANISTPELNATALGSTALPRSNGFLPTLLTVLALLDPQILLRTVLKSVVHVVIAPAFNGEPVQWESAFLFAPLSRPQSLLSGVETLSSATKLPIVNNALIDVLEGQLTCLAIVAAFILVFLIREWVINQQPLLNVPEEDHADHQAPAPAPAPAPNEERQAIRRRRRAIRRVAEHQAQPQDQEGQPLQRPRAPLRLRRRATDNNILIQGPTRPDPPQRAASLVPALQEMEANARSLEELLRGPGVRSVESPPLERGAFDEIGQIRRTIEEADSMHSLPEVQHRVIGTDSQIGTTSGTHLDSRPTFAPFVAEPIPFSQNEFTFRAPRDTSMPPNSGPSQPNVDFSRVSSETHSTVESAPVLIPTPRDSDPDTTTADDLAQTADAAVEDAQSAHDSDESASDGGSTDTENEDQDPLDADAEPDHIWNRISKWLWHTDDFVPGAVLDDPGDETEIVADIDAQAPFVPARPAEAAQPAAPRPEPGPNLQNGVNINDPNAIDEAEDLEGILELIGMEGPIAGMIQNIIFSVFLITLTLSASVWCPYIWGKIALLIVAHPVSVFFRAPLYLLSRTADFFIDIGLLSVGLVGLLLSYITTGVRLMMMFVSPRVSKLLEMKMLEIFSISLSQNSSSRLEKMISRTFLGFRPDLPTFSIQSHHVLRVFAGTVKGIASGLASFTLSLCVADNTMTWNRVFTAPIKLGPLARELPTTMALLFDTIRSWCLQLHDDLRPVSFANPEEIDFTLVHWSSKEKIVCILLGYILFTVAGAVYLRVARWYLGLKSDEKVPGFVGDILNQAGGVMKVIVIIGIEMIVFPLYCGTMLDMALLPIFEGATLLSRLNFFSRAPLTALFIHWFIGTCYMFHFALFVSMCRKIMRKGVLYFIRDPDDPTFHPVRDVLERPVATQLGKIAFSAFVYGSLLVICLGGVVNGLSRIGNILPIRWGTLDPMMIIPGDIIFYSFLLPVMLRNIDISGKVSSIFRWWFRACAAGLRLSDFLFGADVEDEKNPGAFLWHRFIKLLVYGEEIPKHPMIKYVEDLASDRDRLIWFETKNGVVDDEAVAKVFPNMHFKVINLHSDKSQALIHFEAGTSVAQIRTAVDAETSKQDSGFSVRKVKDMKIENVELPNLRKTPVNQAAGSYVRAPAKDSTRISKGTSVFVKVDEKNVRLDGGDDSSNGLHGKDDDRFTRIYVPNHFRSRILTFIGLVWLFAAVVGLVFTVGPLVLGRVIMKAFVGPVSDLYTITAGAHAFAAVVYLGPMLQSHWKNGVAKSSVFVRSAREALPRVARFGKQAMGIIYLSLAMGFVVPMALSLLAELYINIPAYMYLVSDNSRNTLSNPLGSPTQGSRTLPIVHILQTWALGLVYLRAVIRLMVNTSEGDTRPAAAVRAITRHGILSPDVKLASRAIILPVLLASFFLIGLPPGIARIALMAYPKDLDADQLLTVYRSSYPCMLFAALLTFLLLRLQARVENWRVKIRDEVYLIGERLHNFPGQDKSVGRKRSQRRKSGKGKEKVTVDATRPSQPRSVEDKTISTAALRETVIESLDR